MAGPVGGHLSQHQPAGDQRSGTSVSHHTAGDLAGVVRHVRQVPGGRQGDREVLSLHTVCDTVRRERRGGVTHAACNSGRPISLHHACMLYIPSMTFVFLGSEYQQFRQVVISLLMTS